MAAVLLVALATRLPLLLGYAPTTAPDTGTYLQAAQDLLSGDFSAGQGRRTPGYPLVVAALGGQAMVIFAVQALSGVVMCVMLTWLTWSMTGSRAWAAAAGLAHAFNLQQLFQEAMLLTETVSAFSVTAALVLLVATCTRLKRGELPVAALMGLGVLSAYALLVRPQFLCLLIVAPAAVIYAASGWRWPKARALGAGALVLVPAVALVLAWCAVQQAKTGYFTLSTQSGFGMVNHPIDYIELAPDEYATVREVLVRVRDQRIAEEGHSRNTIWYAWPDIQKATGWTLPEASRQLQAMCRKMFIAYPGRYARSVFSAWVDFWTVPFFWKPEQIGSAGLRATLEGVWWVEHKLLRAANLAFVLLVAAVVVWPALRRRVRWDIGLSTIAATVLMSSLIQALADQGASSRYHLPTQSLVVLVLLVAAARWRQRRADITHPS